MSFHFIKIAVGFPQRAILNTVSILFGAKSPKFIVFSMNFFRYDKTVTRAVLCNITISLKCFNIKFHPIPNVK